MCFSVLKNRTPSKIRELSMYQMLMRIYDENKKMTIGCDSVKVINNPD